jgi:hypothetical protein
VQVTPKLNWQQMCYAELGTERYWVKKEFVRECIVKSELLDDKDFISFKPNVRYFLNLNRMLIHS